MRSDVQYSSNNATQYACKRNSSESFDKNASYRVQKCDEGSMHVRLRMRKALHVSQIVNNDRGQQLETLCNWSSDTPRNPQNPCFHSVTFTYMGMADWRQIEDPKWLLNFVRQRAFSNFLVARSHLIVAISQVMQTLISIIMWNSFSKPGAFLYGDFETGQYGPILVSRYWWWTVSSARFTVPGRAQRVLHLAACPLHMGIINLV